MRPLFALKIGVSCPPGDICEPHDPLGADDGAVFLAVVVGTAECDVVRAAGCVVCVDVVGVDVGVATVCVGLAQVTETALAEVTGVGEQLVAPETRAAAALWWADDEQPVRVSKAAAPLTEASAAERSETGMNVLV